MRIRNKVVAVAMTAAALGVGLITAPSASATPNPGTCALYEPCLYFNSNFAGATFGDDAGNSNTPENYGSPNWYTFSGGNGAGYYVKNNAASVWNFNSADSVWIYYNSNNSGPSQRFYNNQGGNLDSTLKNNNASQCLDHYGYCP